MGSKDPETTQAIGSPVSSVKRMIFSQECTAMRVNSSLWRICCVSPAARGEVCDAAAYRSTRTTF